MSIALAACGGTAPQVRYYQLAVQTPPSTKVGAKVLVVESLSSDAAYDDERIVYRNSPYQLDYYNYHRWSAAPGVLVGGYLQQAFGRTGEWKAVVRDQTADAALVLSGRIIALEEVDQDKQHWMGRVAIELTLTDPKTGNVMWSHPYEENEPLSTQTPEGLARALSIALDRIATKAGAEIVAHANDAQAAAN
ncbi:MAG TPA: ABC-type transport auxiliary lipoprotein family protein [Kofleriaceae bacterium]